MYKFRPQKKKKSHPKLKCLPVEGECQRRGAREQARGKKEIMEMHEIGTDGRRDEFPDNIQLVHSSM